MKQTVFINKTTNLNEARINLSNREVQKNK